MDRWKRSSLWPQLAFFLMAFLIHTARGLCPGTCECNDNTLEVNCIKAGLDVMPNTLNPGLTKIVYKYNDFPTVDVSMRFLPRLIEADLSHNQIMTIEERTFVMQRSLKRLVLESNKIGEVSNKSFEGLRSLEVLSLRANQIERLGENLFKFTPKLTELDLSRNRIDEIHESAFRGLGSLRILRLADNDLPAVPVAALSALPMLAELYLSGNPLTVVPPSAFVVSKSLVTLDLTSCRLRSLSKTALRGLGSLKSLKLADNKLASVPTEALSGVPGLESLDLGRNPFQVVHAFAFRHLGQLKSLELSACGRLATLEPGAFAGCTNLERVELAMNRELTRIAPAAFDVMPRLTRLNLADNGLTSVSEQAFPWDSLRELDLSGNPWACGCDLVFLPAALAKFSTSSRQLPAVGSASNVTTLVDGKCAGPAELSRRPLKTLTAEAILSLADNNCDNVDTPTPVAAAQPHSNQGGVASREDDEMGVVSSADDANALAVIISVSVVVATVSLVVVFLVFLRFRGRVGDCVKAWRLDHASSSVKKSNHSLHYDPYVRQSNEYRSTLPVGSGFSAQPANPYTCDDEHYYYVATMQNRAASGKHIPVTEL